MQKRNLVQAVIDRLEVMPKKGESYDEKGRHGWRNPIREDTGPILRALVLAKQPRRVLEIGTAYGLSLCHIAINAPESCKFVTIEWDSETAVQANINLDEAGLASRSEVLCGDAVQIIKSELGGWFDFVFLDANKDGYLEQFKLLQERGALGQGCLVVADNVIDRQTECQNFLDYMSQYNPEILQTECGLLVAHF